MRRSGTRLLVGTGVLVASALGVALTTTPATATAAPQAQITGASLRAASSSTASAGLHRAATGHAAQPRDFGPSCSFNGSSAPVIATSPGGTVSISCSGWTPFDSIIAGEISPLALVSGSADDTDTADLQYFTSDGAGNLSATFTVPNPFVANDPAAVCPPTNAQVAAGLLRCGLLVTDGVDNSPGYVGNALVAFDYPPPAAPTAVGIAATPNGGGYWIAWSNGRVSDHGSAGNFGDASNLTLAAPVSHIVATPSGLGYWLVASDGGTFAYGDAGFFGSMGGTPLNRPVVDLAPTSDGKGYWLVASDGGIFAFGDANFHGSMGGQLLNRPVVGLAPDDATGGYWEVATDGGIFAFGAPFLGSTGNLRLNQPINGMSSTTDDGGYLFVASDGGIFAFGDAGFYGSAGNLALNAPVVGMALDPTTGGYWLLGADGGIFAYHCPFYGAG
ncbi:MAG TPA: hypothetical protein VII96_00565 [Acidimicrobiales bacterium]